MKRRDLLQVAGLAAASALASGCASRRTTSAAQAPPPPKPARAPVNLAVPRISWERVIRTTVGLRPHRDSGFVLRAEKFDPKTLIHDYGFGGAGMSLAWGCGAMAAEMALEHGERRAAVLGCGSPGLTAARQLQRRGFQVTIYAYVRAARHHLQHVLRRIHAHDSSDCAGTPHAGVGCAVPPGCRDFLPATPAYGRRTRLWRLLDG